MSHILPVREEAYLVSLKREEIKEYFESRLCSDLSQEYCSDCKLTRKNGDYCEDVHSQVSETLSDLAKLGVVIKVDKGYHTTISSIELVEVKPLIG